MPAPSLPHPQRGALKDATGQRERSDRVPVCRAVFGGTFDPVHLGHLHAARLGRDALGIASVTLLPAARPWHRSAPQASAAHRWRMLTLATAGDRLDVSRLELERDGPSYTVDTLRDLTRDGPVVWFIGGDALDSVSEWHRAAEVPTLCNLLVFERPGAPRQRSAPPGFEVVGDPTALASREHGGIHFLTAGMLDISATTVRRTIATDRNPGALLPATVWDYIRRNGLYGAREPPASG